MRRAPLSEARPVMTEHDVMVDHISVGAGEVREVALMFAGDHELRVDVAGTLRLACDVRPTDVARVRIVGTVSGEGILECDVSTLLAQGVAVDVVTKFVVADVASVSVRSIVEEAKDCVTANVSHAHHHLMLSRQARAHTVPELFIRHEGVQAHHAVTLTHVDEAALAYAGVRGIDAAQAAKILTDGFLWT